MKKPVRMIVITTFGEVGPCLKEDLQGFLDRKAVQGTDMVRQTNGRILGTVASVMAKGDAPGTAEYTPGPSASPGSDTDGIPTAILSASSKPSSSPTGMVRRSAARAVPPATPADPSPAASAPSTTASPLTRRIRPGSPPLPAAENQAVALPAAAPRAAAMVDWSEVPATATSRPVPAEVAKPVAAPRAVGRRRAGTDGTTERRPASSSSRRMVWILGGIGVCFVCIGIAAGLILRSKPIPPPANGSGPEVVATAAAEQTRQPEPLTTPVPAPPAETPPQPPSSPAANVPETVVATAAAAIPPAPTAPTPPAPPTPPVLLLANEATLQGGLKLESTPPNLGYWIKAQDRATWSVNIDRPGTFSVALEYALDPSGRNNEFTLEVGDRKITGTNAPTRNWKDYTCTNIGTVAVPSAGTITVVLRPTRQPRGGLMNLRRIILTPALP